MNCTTARCSVFDTRLRWRRNFPAGRVARRHEHSAWVEIPGEAGMMLLLSGRALVPWGLVFPSGKSLPPLGAMVRLDGAGLDLSWPDGSRERYLLAGEGRDLFVPLTMDGGRFRQAPKSRAGGPRSWLPDRTRALLEAAGGSIAPAGEGGSMTRFDRLELTRLGLALEALAASVLSGCRGSPARLGTAVRGLLGLGRGTTPSGDDLLAGAAAAARAGGLPGARCLCQTLAELAPGSTTPAGEAMLREAAAGFFPHPLAALARSWPEPRRATLDALIGIGVSSGADMLAGFLAITEGRHA